VVTPALDNAPYPPQSATTRLAQLRTGSWTPQAPAGAYAAVVAWRSGAAWLDALMDALATVKGEELRRRISIAPATFLAVANADRLAADGATGRGVATAHETVAQRLGMSAKTVERARTLMQRLGFAVTIVEGRYLTRAERAAAHAVHGGRQVRAASLRALTVPRSQDLPQAVENVELPRRGSLNSSTYLPEIHTTQAHAPAEAATRQPRTTGGRKTRNQFRSRAPRSILLQRFAAELCSKPSPGARRLPWLGRGRHIGAVVTMLERAGVDPTRFTVDGLMATLDRHVQEHHIRVPEIAHQVNPLGYYAWLLRQVVAKSHPTVDEERTARDERRRAEREQRAAELAADIERVAAINTAEVAAIIDQMKHDQAERDAATRRRKAEDRTRRYAESASSPVRLRPFPVDAD
jgi:hypothetical protein